METEEELTDVLAAPPGVRSYVEAFIAARSPVRSRPPFAGSCPSCCSISGRRATSAIPRSTACSSPRLQVIRGSSGAARPRCNVIVRELQHALILRGGRAPALIQIRCRRAVLRDRRRRERVLALDEFSRTGRVPGQALSGASARCASADQGLEGRLSSQGAHDRGRVPNRRSWAGSGPRSHGIRVQYGGTRGWARSAARRARMHRSTARPSQGGRRRWRGPRMPRRFEQRQQ